MISIIGAEFQMVPKEFWDPRFSLVLLGSYYSDSSANWSFGTVHSAWSIGVLFSEASCELEFLVASLVVECVTMRIFWHIL